MKYITNTDSSILPYNDDSMKYDIDLREYIITDNGFKNYTGFSLEDEFDSPQELEAFYRETSDDIYEYIYANSSIDTVKFKRWLIAKDSAIREDFKKALIVQARANFRSGMHLLKDQHGINIERSKALSLNDIRGKVQLSRQVIDILSRINLLYQGYMYFSDYEEDGTY